MPLVETRGAASAQGFGFLSGQATAGLYIEDVFSTFLYTGNGSTQTITNGIDLSTQGGLVWMKGRSGATDHALYDTARGATKDLVSNSVAAETTQSTGLTAFGTTGFTIGALAKLNTSSATYASWTFRKQPKFFDVVTYTGTGSNTTISHNLGAVPGCIIVKRTDTAADWQVYHRSLANTEYMVLNSDAAKATGTTRWNSTTPTSTVFSLGTDTTVNASGGTYVAYLFAHDAGGFGASGTDNVISCGSFTTDVNGQATVNIGYEPQFILTKTTTNTGSDQWVLVDSMRGLCTAGLFLGLPTSNNPPLWPNLSQNEGGSTNIGGTPTSTGFTWNSSPSGTRIYIAIRRGPMRTPTSGTSVFEPVAATQGLNSSTPATSSITDDTFISSGRTSGIVQFNVGDRLRGGNFIFTQGVDAESTFSYYDWGRQTGVAFTANLTTSGSLIMYHLRRAPGFFDVVCYTGTGSTTTFNHNLRALPEMMIIKRRDTSADWWVYDAATGNTKYQVLNSTAISVTSSTAWNNTTPTSSVFSVGTGTPVNASAGTYVAYLFASVPGVSKVFSYTGNGSSQTINCGFTAGARFVLIKRTDSTGDWYVWDSARGIVAGNDPHSSLNSTAAEVTTDDSVDTDNTGFVVNQVAATNINVTSGTYIGLAIA